MKSTSRNYFGQIPFFAISKLLKINFELGKSLKLPKMQFYEKNYLISQVFLPGLFQIFWPAVNKISEIDFTEKTIWK